MNGKIRILFTTLYGSLMEYSKSLYRKLKVRSALKMLYVQLKKVEPLVLAYLDGTRIFKKKEYRLKDYFLSMKQEKYSHRLRLNQRERAWIWLNILVSLCGVLVRACVTLIFALSLLLLAIVSCLVTLAPALSLGLLIFLLSSLLKGHL